MHRRPSRALPVRGLLLSLSLLLGAITPASAQSGRGAPSRPIPPQPAVTTPARPAIVTPARPAIVTPAQPAITYPARPAVTYPAQPAVVTPAKPAVTYPAGPAVTYPAGPAVTYPTGPGGTYPTGPGVGTPKPIAIKPGSPGLGLPTQNPPPKPIKPIHPPLPYPPDHDHGHHHHPPHCYPYYSYPVVIIPSYPSAYIGSEIVSITTYPTEDTTAPSTVPAPPVMDPAAGALQGNEATPRLIAILGRIQRVDAGVPSGASRTSGSESKSMSTSKTGGDGERLCLGLATLTVYHPASPDEPSEAIARGTYLGSRWDGDLWHTSATGTWSRGPVTRQPI
ncbi:MAG: hypothetical protein ACAH88_12470, partial [Roseimicrobium sp.]